MIRSAADDPRQGTSVTLPAVALKAIEKAALAAYPEECCGLLVGEEAAEAIAVRRAVAGRNVAADPARRFEVDPALWLGLRRDLAGGRERIVGLYHSHPDGAAAPSPADAAAVWDLGAGGALAWIIVPVTRGAAGRPEAWLSVPGAPGFRPARLAILA